jgi:hypothetical protein
MSNAPANTYEAAAWLRDRHSWLDELLTRVLGRADSEDISGHWLDELVAGFTDMARTERARLEYEQRNPAPDDDSAFSLWLDARPTYTTEAAQCLAPMSSGEIRALRLLTTLGRGDRVAVGWRVDDIDFDQRGNAIVEDWIQIVRAQMS